MKPKQKTILVLILAFSFFLLLSLCSKDLNESSISPMENPSPNEELLLSEDIKLIEKKGYYIVIMGLYDIPYFAHRMVLKAEKLGFTNAEVLEKKDKLMVRMGPFASDLSAKDASETLKKTVPDMTYYLIKK